MESRGDFILAAEEPQEKVGRSCRERGYCQLPMRMKGAQ